MRKYIWTILLMTVLPGYAQNRDMSDTICRNLSGKEYYAIYPVRKNPWAAALQVAGLDGLSWSVSKYLAKKPFADISLATIKRNMDTGFVWDVDEFPTNMVAHPYQGGLNFATSRAWGMSYLESFPYSFAGSFVWEMFLENEPPSINDLITTSIGGMAYGEVMHRISSGILNNQARGWNRAARELSAFVINPMRGVQRLVTGDMWRHGFSSYADETGGTPVSFSLGLGWRSLMIPRLPDSGNMYLTLNYIYNNPFEVDGRTPFEYFELYGDLNIGNKQPFLGDIRITGLLFGETFGFRRSEMLIGLFQQYSFHDSNAINDKETGKPVVPYRISETAAFGPGAICRITFPDNLMLECKGFVTGIMLGGYYTDYFRFGKRDYNFGSGFSYRASVGLSIGDRLKVSGETQGYKLYTVDGYRQKNYQESDELYLNSAGDKGSGFITMNRIDAKVRIVDELRFGAKINWIMRYNRYKEIPEKLTSSARMKSNDVRFYVEYTF
ncbi:MAG: DUF3943 domain-containing protein [Bacteroidales bacterium]